MATRRRIKPVLNLTHIRKPVKEEKPAEIENDENEKAMFMSPQPHDQEAPPPHSSKEVGHIEPGCQSPTKLKYTKIRPNFPVTASVPTEATGTAVNRIRTESVSSTKSSVFNFHNRERRDSHRIRQISRCEEKERALESKKDIKSRYANPDKMRLTMFDMIYYNPTGNPMQKKPASKPIEDNRDLKKDTKSTIPSPTKEDVKVDLRKPKIEEVSTVPQLKLGPNGEIILDEKSLIIENVKEKEAREQIANSTIQYDDEYSNNYGYYKRQQRTKDWPADETIKFYKCLHTVGTDFSLMLSLFPKRSRRDLKLKYKKEERQNPSLINKALLHPKFFNIEELEEELKQEELAKQEVAAKKAFQVQQSKEKVAGRAPKRSAQIENVKSKMPQRKVSKAMRMMTDGDEVYGTKPTKERKKKVVPFTNTNMDQQAQVIFNPIIIDSPVISTSPQANDGYCPNYPFEDIKQVISHAPVKLFPQPTGFEEVQPIAHEQMIDSKSYEMSKIGVNIEAASYMGHYDQPFDYPPSPNIGQMMMMMPPPPAVMTPRYSPPPSPVRSLPPQSPRSVESNPLTSLSELELDSLVLVESQDPNSKNTHYEVYIMEENGEMSEKPLDLSPDVIESIRIAMMNDA